MNISKFFRLNSRDFWEGLYVAVLTAVLGVLGQAIHSHGLSFAEYDWMGIVDLAWKVTGVYMTTNLLKDESGTPLGMASVKKLGAIFKTVDPEDEE